MWCFLLIWFIFVIVWYSSVWMEDESVLAIIRRVSSSLFYLDVSFESTFATICCVRSLKRPPNTWPLPFIAFIYSVFTYNDFRSYRSMLISSCLSLLNFSMSCIALLTWEELVSGVEFTFFNYLTAGNLAPDLEFTEFLLGLVWLILCSTIIASVLIINFNYNKKMN